MSTLKDIVEAYIEYNKDKMPDKLDALNIMFEREIDKEVNNIEQEANEHQEKRYEYIKPRVKGKKL